MRYSGPLDARKLVARVDRKIFGIPAGKKTVHEWEVLADFRFYHDDANPNLFMLVRRGFVTDLASVPGFFGFVVQKDGEFSQAAVNHDNSYRYRGNVVFKEVTPLPFDSAVHKRNDSVIDERGWVIAVRVPELRLTRKEQDKAFLHGMEILHTFLPVRFIMWRAVHRFGGIRYPKTDYEDKVEQAVDPATIPAGNPILPTPTSIDSNLEDN